MTRIPNINDPAILSVPVRDNGEKLVSPLDLPRTYLPSMIKTDIGINDSQNMFVRETVKNKLQHAIESLPPEIDILLIEGYREYAIQKQLFENQVSKLGSRKAAQMFVSDPDVFSPPGYSVVSPSQLLLSTAATFVVRRQKYP